MNVDSLTVDSEDQESESEGKSLGFKPSQQSLKSSRDKRPVISITNESQSNESESEKKYSENSVVKDSELESETQKPPDIVENILKPSKRVYSTLNPDYSTMDSDVLSEVITRKNWLIIPTWVIKPSLEKKHRQVKADELMFLT